MSFKDFLIENEVNNMSDEDILEVLEPMTDDDDIDEEIDFIIDEDELESLDMSELVVERLIKKRVIRGGKRKIVFRSNRPGYKIVKQDGKRPKEIRMTSAEQRKRLISQKKGARKRKAKFSQAQRKRKISLKKRPS
jgi:hypothetical protein